MFGLLSRGLASLSLLLRQPLSSFCDLDTIDGDALVTKQNEYVTFVEGQGLRRLMQKADVEAIADRLRMELSGSLDHMFARDRGDPSHSMQAIEGCAG